MHPLKPHEIQAGYSLDRRRLIENFLHFAQSLNSIEDFNIARKSLSRMKFASDAFEEVYWNNIDSFTQTPDFVPSSQRFASGSALLTGLSSGEYKLDWSCNILPTDPMATGVQVYAIIFVPFLDGKILWDAGDMLMDPWAYDLGSAGNRTKLTNYYHSVGGSCTLNISSGKSEMGLAAIPFSDAWLFSQCEVSNLQFVARRRVR